MSKQVKLPPQLNLPSSINSTFYTGKLESAQSSVNFKRKYKFGLLSPNPSGVFITNSGLQPQSVRDSLDKRGMKNSSSMKQLSLHGSIPRLDLHRNSLEAARGSFQITGHKRSSSQKVVNDDDSEEYITKIRQKTDRKELTYDDERPKMTVGLDAVRDFYSHYKKLDKVVDQNKHKDLRDSIYTTFLRKEEELQLLPSKIGMIKDRGEKSHILINHFKIGDKYAQIIGEGLKVSSEISTIRMANNRISSKGANIILQNISTETEIIDLSKNSIGSVGCHHLAKTLQDKASKLLTLNLEGNKLGDTSIMMLCDGLCKNKTVRMLNIARNYLTNVCTGSLGAFLELNTPLRELYLYWNRIQGQGGCNIFKGLMSNNNLKILDLAWNSLGHQNFPFAKSLSDFVATNTDLVVLDVSNNQIGNEAAKEIADGLSKNHSIYDFMFQGNYGYIDIFGFLIVPDYFQCDTIAQHMLVHTIGKYPNNDSIRKYEHLDSKIMDGCWLSEGWAPVTFRWTPGESGDAADDPIYLHLVFEGLHSIWLPKSSNFQIQIMCPPAEIQYFFTVNGEQVVAIDQPQMPVQNSIFKIELDGIFKFIKMSTVNLFCNEIAPEVIDENFDPLCPLKPRFRPEVYVPDEKIKEKIPWTFPISLFKDYKTDTEDLLKKCFETDFELSRISKIVKKPDELESVKTILRSNYKTLKSAYKYLAAVGITGEVWSIGSNAFTEFLSKCKILDDTMRSKDADLKFIATVTDPSLVKNPRNPEKAIIRYQFLELWVRLAEQKFITSGATTSYSEALQRILNEHVLPYIKQNDSLFNANKWREERYWNEKCDIVYKSYLPILKSFFKKYSGLKTKPGQAKFCCLDELVLIAKDAQILDDNLVDRDLIIIFNQSMMTQLDELNSDRIFQMNFLEFLEALARVAEVCSYPSPGEDWNTSYIEERKKRHLSQKLEALIHVLFNMVAENAVKDSISMPEKSIFQQTDDEIVSLKKKTGRKKFIYRVDPVQFYYGQLNGNRTKSDD